MAPIKGYGGRPCRFDLCVLYVIVKVLLSTNECQIRTVRQQVDVECNFKTFCPPLRAARSSSLPRTWRMIYHYHIKIHHYYTGFIKILVTWPRGCFHLRARCIVGDIDTGWVSLGIFCSRGTPPRVLLHYHYCRYHL